MKKTLTIGAILVVATAAFAHEGVMNPKVQERMDLMVDIKNATGTLGKMARGKMDFDAAAAAQARDILLTSGKGIAAAFAAPEQDPKSEASPAIWDNLSDFNSKADALVQAAMALDASSLDGVGAGMGAIGASCGGCHKPYRL